MGIKQKIFIINGPNLNLLGKREPEIYGSKTFDIYFKELQSLHPEVMLEYFQSNTEGDIINFIHKAVNEAQGIVLNPAAYTHTSIAILDAITMLKIPLIEVHISNIFAREEFRKHSYISPKATGIISGLGLEGYNLAVKFLKGNI